MFRPGHDYTSASSAGSPCNFGSRADVTISVLREVRKMLLLAALKVIPEKNWKRLGVVEPFRLTDFL